MNSYRQTRWTCSWSFLTASHSKFPKACTATFTPTSTIITYKINTIIVSDDAFKFLEKYGLTVISLDPDTVKEKTINTAKELIENNTCSHIYVKYKENNEDINNFINETKVQKIELYTLTNLEGINVEKSNYISLMNQNLENLKVELYK